MSRKLNDQAEEEEENAYLGKYNLKLVGCKAGETVTNAENGETEYSAAIFRLCPTESGCSDTTGCSSGYGDYVIGLTTFVEAYFEDQRDNMQWDDAFQVDKYAKCEQYKVEGGDGDNQYADMQFYIGPTCTSDSKDVRLAVFEDETCTYESETAFESLSNGWSLPFSEGGLVSTSCIDCVDYNDNGEAEIREFCEELTTNAASACEEKMESFSANGQNSEGCDYIKELMPVQQKSSSKGKGGKIFGWFVFVAVVIGLAGYIVWWRKKKQAATSNGLSA
jgi:hypothetical protein